MNRFLLLLVALSLLSLSPQSARSSNPHATLADLKKLEILCYIPAWLPKGFKLKSVSITYDEPGPDEGSAGRFPLYQYEYAGPARGGVETSFTVDCAREGIGDRNLMETEDSEETTITSPFGPMYLIYTPKGQGKAGRNTASSGSGRIDDTKSHPKGEVRGETNFVKKEIKANWAEDPNMKSEKAKDPQAHPILGRYHGFSATGLSLQEFEKVVASLHPIRD